MPVFYLYGDVYKFTRDHATLKFHKPSRVFYVTSTHNKTTKDYMKYRSKMAENRVYRLEQLLRSCSPNFPRASITR